MTVTTTRVSTFALALLVSLGSAQAQTQPPAQDSPAQLAALSREARTDAQHADVARRYRLQAESLDAKAAEQESLAARQAAQAPAIVHKWPSMAPRTLTETKQKAVDYRRAARESRAQAERHRQLAVEALAK